MPGAQFCELTAHLAPATGGLGPTPLEDLHVSGGHTAERAQVVADAAQESVTVSREGERAVADTIESMQLMQQIEQQVYELSDMSRELNKAAERYQLA